jgi:hypothetical protein
MYKATSKKPDLSYINPRSRDGYAKARENEQRHARDLILDDPRHCQSLSLSVVLASYMMALPKSPETLAADGPTLSPQQTSFLKSRGYCLDDVKAWAALVCNEDALQAARDLLVRVRTRGALSVPIFIYEHLLRRNNITARALRVLICCAGEIFGQRINELEHPGIDEMPQFLAITRLIRHARELWPACMPGIARLALDLLQRRRDKCRSEGRRLDVVTAQLNKLVVLISYPTAEQPFKDAKHQEAAFVHILRYMAEHEPPLQVDRLAYRGVIRVQLAQRKSEPERQWAELKSLAWPPWKVDRTAMDSLVTVEDCGLSRASQTLRAMCEAGYRPLKWEEIAEIYAGWDIDKTPTIQRRKSQGPAGLRLSAVLPAHVSESAKWAARIESTRTAQEAWAAYLAWEDRGLPSDSSVYLAIVEKLREEERRHVVEQRQELRVESRTSWPLLPGDSKEVSPLPPSTHLETYTSSPPPTVQNFYNHLQGKHARISSGCLAFFVRHAQTIRFALSCLRDHETTFPAIAPLLQMEYTEKSVRSIPRSLYHAIMTLFTRFAFVGSVRTHYGHAEMQLTVKELGNKMQNVKLDVDVGIVRALDMLRIRAEPHRPFWNTVFAGLTREAHFVLFAQIIVNEHAEKLKALGAGDSSPESLEMKRCDGALNAYWLVRQLRVMQNRHHMDVDSQGFFSQCLATEHMVTALWKTLLAFTALDCPESELTGIWATRMRHLRYTARNVFREGPSPNKWDAFVLKKTFWALVDGANADGTQKNHTEEPLPSREDTLMLPRLLTVPSPALLHTYIRSLGWLADYRGILELVQWMRKYRLELASRKKQDRAGDDAMRKAIVALRVFLERSWLSDDPSKTWEVVGRRDGEDPEDAPVRVRGNRPMKILASFSQPASAELIASVRDIVVEVEEWEGWPDDTEVRKYAADVRFDPFRDAVRIVPVVEQTAHDGARS